VQLLDSLPARMSTLERSLSALQGVSAGARETWLVAEAEYYMQIANAQLQLAGNPHLAALALGMADERLVQLANPALTDVRRALSDELAALDGMDKPDIEGVTLNLASLARVVDSLPLRQLTESGSDDDADVDTEASGMARAWSSVKRAMSGLVKVTGPEQAAAPLLTPEAVYFLRTNLTLQLQTARLALLRGEQAVFQQSLDDAAAWLEQYFDTQSAQVESALQTIAEIRDGMFVVKAPDISESLQLLRQYKTINESAQ
ncbi:MAG: uroporphyrinogen-III C-methyltransferase, partial [Gammaproteobacteria bacterium]|nr:uroporphyrinogen-III C-methyltransferase [Gammaproteobacteria bacterium]MDH3409443.1 uroporphyrinogen-III C-methyltransferase [Gammaproteobacteria bacterium]